jgi:hypothetical protein
MIFRYKRKTYNPTTTQNKMDAYHGYSSPSNYNPPEFFYRNGKTPQTIRIENADGSIHLAHVNSTNGEALSERHLKEIKNQAKTQMKKELAREGMLERLEKRKALKNKL